MSKKKEWRCFFCDEVFTDSKSAWEHFGDEVGCDPPVPACKLNQLEGGLLKLYREALEEIQNYQNENDLISKYFYELGSSHYQALRRAEEEGYAKGIRDAGIIGRLRWYIRRLV